MDKISILLSIFIGITLKVNHGILAVEQPPDGKIQNRSEYCLLPECFHAAATILANRDSTIQPCDNFYSFACGNFMAKQEIPEDEAEITSLDQTRDNVNIKLQTYFTTQQSNNDLRIFGDLKNLYNLCMNESLIEEQGKTKLFQIIETFGGWPVLLGDKWNETFDWLELMGKRADLGFDIDTFLTIKFDPDIKNSSRFILAIHEAAPMYPHEYLLLDMNNPVLEAYLQYMVDLAVLLGADKGSANQELREVLLFGRNLANITSSINEFDAAENYNPKTIQELSKMYPNIQWKELLNKILDPITEITNDEIINVTEPQLIPKLLKLLQSTPKRVQANYAMWKVVSYVAQFLTKDFRNAPLQVSSIIDGQTENQPRWKQCISEICELLPVATGSLFVRKYFPKDAKKLVTEMVNEIQNTFRNILWKVDWMDNSTKHTALEKVCAMFTSHIGYPDELLNDTIIEEYYANLKISSTNYLEAILNVMRFQSIENTKRFRKSTHDGKWIDHSTTTVFNAFYGYTDNSLRLPAAYMQGLLFNETRPNYINYAGIGHVIGHEIVHGFDDSGQNYDKDGHFTEWWSPSSQSKFLEKAQCIIDQYSNYTVMEIDENINGEATLGENIADIGGIKAAYMSYNEWVKRNGKEPKLPGLEYTNQQMFWISMANMWCTKSRLEVLRERILIGAGHPGEYRVTGMISNSPEFFRDFNCQPDSKMIPKKKCSIW